MNDAARPETGDERVQCRTVRDVAFDLAEAPARCDSSNLLEAVALELRVVVPVEIVQSDDGLATRQQRRAHGLPDEAGATGYQDHARPTP